VLQHLHAVVVLFDLFDIIGLVCAVGIEEKIQVRAIGLAQHCKLSNLHASSIMITASMCPQPFRRS
jgi:hypothetical protein